MNHQTETTPMHCYTNPSFCRQSEYMHDERNDLPPPPQFQSEDLPPPPSPQQLHQQYGQTNRAFQSQPETVAEFQPRDTATPDRYCYLKETRPTDHRRYGSLPVQEQQKLTYTQSSRYEYIQDDERTQLQRTGSSRYGFIPSQQVQRSAPLTNQDNGRTTRNNGARYAFVPGDLEYQDNEAAWNAAKFTSPFRKLISTPQGRYTSLPLEEPPTLPDRNLQEFPVSPRNNLATQKLHEILTTPRKRRSRSEERALSPRRHHTTPQRRAFTPSCSPTRRALSPTIRGTPLSMAFLLNGSQTSTPNKEPSARRCLPLSPASICAEAFRHADSGHPSIANVYGCIVPRYPYMQDRLDKVPMMMPNSLKYQAIPPEKKRNEYLSVESAFIAKTAVVPPLSPPTSEANTTLISGADKYDQKNAPLLLLLVGILTCGLSFYLSWAQGRRYYFDSAIGCGACCALAGASRSLRRTWTGLGLAGLSALSCAGLLLLAVKAPKPGNPLHDVTAGALCGVSVLGATLALLAVLKPRCNFGRHRRVHSWIPRFSP